MSDTTMDQVTNYVEKMAATLTGDRGQTHSDLCKLLGIIRGDIPFSGPGIQSLASAARSNIRMTPTAATPKPPSDGEGIAPAEGITPPQPAKKAKTKKKSKAKAEGAEA